VFLVERGLAMLRRRLAGDRPDQIRTVWADGDAATLAAALDDLSSPQLFGGPQALVIRRADALVARDEELVLRSVPRLQPPACLVLVAGALDGRRKLLAAFERAGAAFAVPRVTEPQALQEWVVRLAGEAGQAIRPAAAARLVERTTLDLAGLASEVEKATLFAGPGTTVEVEHVDAIAAGGRAAAVEALSDRLARGDHAGAAHALRGLLRAGEPPLRIVAFLAANLRRTLHVAELAERGLGRDAIAAALGMPGWLVRRIQDRREAVRLERGLDVLRRLDLELKTSRPPGAVLDAALAALVQPAPPSAPRRP
jgi:DNA polymerase-3 subunit delta